LAPAATFKTFRDRLFLVNCSKQGWSQRIMFSASLLTTDDEWQTSSDAVHVASCQACNHQCVSITLHFLRHDTLGRSTVRPQKPAPTNQIKVSPLRPRLIGRRPKRHKVSESRRCFAFWVGLLRWSLTGKLIAKKTKKLSGSVVLNISWFVATFLRLTTLLAPCSSI